MCYASGMATGTSQDLGAAGLTGGQAALTGAGLGATLGSVVPGVGTLIGAGIGAGAGLLIGALSGGFANKAARKAEEDAEKARSQAEKEAGDLAERARAAQAAASKSQRPGGYGPMDQELAMALPASGGRAFDAWHAQVFGA